MNDRNKLIARLQVIPEVARYTDESHDEAETLADLIEHCSEALVRAETAARIIQSAEENGGLDSLQSLGEELRHVLYHVRDSRFFSYIADQII